MSNLGEVMAHVLVDGRFKRYTERSKWKTLELKNLDKDLQDLNTYSLNNETKDHNAQTKTLSGNKIILPESDKYNIWNVWIKIHITDHINFLDDLLTYEISLLINGCITSVVPMTHNLFIAQFLNREIIEGPDYVDIPVILLDLFFPEKFPIYTISNSTISFILGHSKLQISEIRFDYEQVFKLPDDKPTMVPIFQCNFIGYYRVNQACSNLYPSLNEVDTVYLNIWRINHVCKLLFFEFKNYEVDEPILESVILYLNGQPITYLASEGMIIRSCFMENKTIYAISLTPEFMVEEDMCKLFVTPRSCIENGINFSRVDNTKIKFEFDQEYPGLCVNISSIACNLFMTSDKNGLLRYAS